MNPFEEFDIEPLDGPEAITERLRELLEEAGDEEKVRIRKAWEELTLHPARRFEHASAALPSAHPPFDEPPKPAPYPPSRPQGLAGLEQRELLVRQSVEDSLGPAAPAPFPDILKDPLL